LLAAGEVYDVDIDPAVLQLAVQNTVKLLIANTKVNEETPDLLDQEAT
jgi:hypothetical protein